MDGDTRVDVYLPLYVRDFLTSTIGWTAEERGHYLTLLMLQWDRGGLPAGLDDLERLSPGVARCWPLLTGKFQAGDDGLLRNLKLEEHRRRCIELREKRSQAAQSAASRRWAAAGDASRIANASQTHSKRIAKPCHPTSTSTSYEEIPAAQVATSEPPPKRRIRSRPDAGISWSADAGWQGITDTDAAEWRLAYPACDLTAELARAGAWLKANPTKAHKSNWRRFLVAWLTRSQDRGGSNREPGRRPDGPPPVDQAKRRFYRADAGKAMTEAEYVIWRRERTGGVAASVAAALTITEGSA